MCASISRHESSRDLDPDTQADDCLLWKQHALVSVNESMPGGCHFHQGSAQLPSAEQSQRIKVGMALLCLGAVVEAGHNLALCSATN